MKPSPSAATKYDHPVIRGHILRLLEIQGTVTRLRMGEALGVSRMTAHRVAERLITEGLIVERQGIDPVSGRQSHLLALTPTPPLLLLDLGDNASTMTAYLCDAEKIKHLQTDYRLTTDIVGNELTLCDLAGRFWHLPDTVACVALRTGNTSPRAVTPPFQNMYTVSKETALAHALTLHPVLASYRSLLYLSSHPKGAGALYVRETPDMPWFVPSGGLLSCDEDIFIHPSETADFLTTYCQCIRPDVILWEDTPPSILRGNRLGDELMPFGEIKLSPPQRNTRVADILKKVHTHIPSLICDRKTPLAVMGAIGLWQEMLWTDTQPFLPY